MRKFIARCAAAALVLSVAACSSMQVKKDAIPPRYTTVLVKPLTFNDIFLQKVSGNEQEEFEHAKPALAKAFNESFSQALPGSGSARRLLFEGTPDQATIVLEAKVSLLDPGIKRVLRGRGVAVCSLIDGGTGRLLGSFTVTPEVNRPDWQSASEVIEALVRSMGAGAAAQMAQAR
ncbi:MAG TPA: hypothetical protein DCZ75_12395 [Geobacter sp.]|nr:hypothetical protein [Geobacter sp.]